MTTIRRASEDDFDRVLRLEAQAFNLPKSTFETRRRRMDPSRITVAERDGSIAATMRAIEFGHFFGGRSVRAAGISGVAVSADARGTGLGTALMTHTLGELRERGVAISSLYPATVPIYRSLGYGYGGVRTSWKARLSDLPDDGARGAAEFDLSAIGELDRTYRRFAADQNGLVDRDQEWWEVRVFEVDDDSLRYRYLFREGGEVTGWIMYALRSQRDSWRSIVSCRDLYWRTPTAARALLSLAALHRSTSDELRWVGPPVEVLGDLGGEDVVQHDGAFRWMVRLLDVPAAFEQRGYNPAVETEVTIDVRDRQFEANAGPWRVRVSGGRAKVAPADGAGASADVQTWASLWTGLLPPRDAVRLGTLEASEDAVHALEAMFAGPTPWIADFY